MGPKSFSHKCVNGKCFVSNDILLPHWDETDRLAALRSYRILDTPAEPEFDDLVQLAARACRTPIALISLVEDRRQWFKAEIGLGVRETTLDRSICLSAMLQPGLTVIPSLTEDSRFTANPLVKDEPHLRFYAGAVLETPEGLPLGALCVLDTVPRGLTDDQSFTLQTLARQVMSQMELRRAIAERDEVLAASRRIEERQALLVRELHHRVKNTLATVQALVGATGRSSGSFEEFYTSFSKRISSLAKTHNLLTEDYWQAAPLRDLALNELKPFAESRKPRFMLIGPQIELSADLAVPIGMALHELTTNAVRHGALSVPDGYVEVRWDIVTDESGRRLQLEWIERGGPPARPPTQEGFGSTLLRRVLPMQINADVQTDFDAEGLKFRLVAPYHDRRLVPAY